jgi:large subunit ribosomal protein L20
MARVKRGTSAHKRRKNILAQTKGFRWGRKSKYRTAKDALRHAQEYAYRDRKAKKGVFRALWQLKIGEAAKAQGVSYSKLIPLLKKHSIELDRKILSEILQKSPATFAKIIEIAKS